MMSLFICIILFWAIGVESNASTRKGYKVTNFNLTLSLVNSSVPLVNSSAETPVNFTRVYKRRFQPTNTSSPSITNTTIVSAAMARLVPVSFEPVLKVPRAEKIKTKTWVPTCPSSMPTICPQLTNSTGIMSKKISEFPTIAVSSALPPQKIQKYCNRPYLRGGTINNNNNNNSEKKNLRGGF
jgi:hypothetical protein